MGMSMRRIKWIDVILLVVIGLFILVVILTETHNRPKYGDVTIYGISGKLAHYEDCKYKVVNDSIEITVDGKTMKYINCNVEVKE